MNFKLSISVIIVRMISQSIFGGSLLSRGTRPAEVQSETVQQVVVEQKAELIAPEPLQVQKKEEVADVQPAHVQEVSTVAEQSQPDTESSDSDSTVDSESEYSTDSSEDSGYEVEF